MKDVGVIYLYRFAEGEHPVKRFIQSYREHPAGLAHDLHVVFKGFQDQSHLEYGQSLFADIPINSIVLADSGYDIGSYVQAAKAVSNNRVIFLNTFSQILADGWLAHFSRASNLPGVGLVGASGSWHASTSSYEGALKALFRRIRQSLSGRNDSKQKNPCEPAWPMRNRSLRRYLLAPFGYLYSYLKFGRYPNPHIRTNAFMIERDRFLSLNFPLFKTKSDVYQFESGRRSMTKQISAQGLQSIVVDRNGKTYDVTEWKASSTFWTSDQVNLTVADNRTSDYATGNKRIQEFLEDSAWVHPWSWR